jgi:hypothetical protein
MWMMSIEFFLQDGHSKAIQTPIAGNCVLFCRQPINGFFFVVEDAHIQPAVDGSSFVKIISLPYKYG